MIDPQAKLWSQPDAISAFLAHDDTAPPAQIEIAPTNRCNARCPWCFYVAHASKPKHSRQELPIEVLADALRDARDLGVQAIGWSGGGEPSLYPAITEAVELAQGCGLRQGLFTNGYKFLPCADRLAWVRISITERLVVPPTATQYANCTRTGVVVNVTPENADQLDRLAREARCAGVHYFQVRPALADHRSRQPALECPQALLRHETATFRVILSPYKWSDCHQPQGYPVCHGHRLVPFIWYDGSVTVCGYHFGKPEFTFGNVHQESLASIWRGPKRREMLARGIEVVESCQHCCKLHEVNKALARLRRECRVVHEEFV
jgi:MoaA/NifB/PqqE/SkfB family radical SAM enzyme